MYVNLHLNTKQNALTTACKIDLLVNYYAICHIHPMVFRLTPKNWCIYTCFLRSD
jgi:hypothetical protein